MALNISSNPLFSGIGRPGQYTNYDGQLIPGGYWNGNQFVLPPISARARQTQQQPATQDDGGLLGGQQGKGGLLGRLPVPDYGNNDNGSSGPEGVTGGGSYSYNDIFGDGQGPTLAGNNNPGASGGGLLPGGGAFPNARSMDLGFGGGLLASAIPGVATVNGIGNVVNTANNHSLLTDAGITPTGWQTVGGLFGLNGLSGTSADAFSQMYNNPATRAQMAALYGNEYYAGNTYAGAPPNGPVDPLSQEGLIFNFQNLPHAPGTQGIASAPLGPVAGGDWGDMGGNVGAVGLTDQQAADNAANFSAGAGSMTGDYDTSYGGDYVSDSGGGGGSGDSVICTALYANGSISKEIWEADEAYGRSLPRAVIVGYHTWARPFVKMMNRSPLMFRVGKYLGMGWANEMAYRRGVPGAKPSLIGKFALAVMVPLCGLIGRRKASRRRGGLHMPGLFS